MADEKNLEPEENNEEELVIDGEYVLTDENGEDRTFILIGYEELDGAEYLALIPKSEEENDEYVILKLEKDESGEEVLVTIDDDEEFDKIAGIFDDSLFADEG